MEQVIETDVWVENSEKPGFLKFERMKTYDEIFQELVQVLKEHGVYDDLDYFSYSSISQKTGKPFPNYRWIACFAVEGGSEGYYIHVDAISEEGIEHAFLGKTFLGIEHATKVSNICTQAFYR